MADTWLDMSAPRNPSLIPLQAPDDSRIGDAQSKVIQLQLQGQMEPKSLDKALFPNMRKVQSLVGFGRVEGLSGPLSSALIAQPFTSGCHTCVIIFYTPVS